MNPELARTPAPGGSCCKFQSIYFNPKVSSTLGIPLTQIHLHLFFDWDFSARSHVKGSRFHPIGIAFHKVNCLYKDFPFAPLRWKVGKICVWSWKRLKCKGRRDFELIRERNFWWQFYQEVYIELPSVMWQLSYTLRRIYISIYLGGISAHVHFNGIDMLSFRTCWRHSIKFNTFLWNYYLIVSSIKRS